MSKIVAVKDEADEGEEILEKRWPKVSKKKEYIDLFERVRGGFVVEEEFEAHPRIRKSIGSIKLAEFTLSSQDSSQGLFDVPEEVVAKEMCPWNLDVIPTPIEEILDNWILERFEEENTEEIPIERKQRIKIMIRQFFQRHFGVKESFYIKKKIEDRMIEPGRDLQREFHELSRKFTEEKILGAERGAKESSEIVIDSTIHTHDSSSKPSTSNFIPEIKAAGSVSVESTGQCKRNSEFSRQQENDVSSSSERFSGEGCIDEQRFKITAVLSDFSLQKQTLFPDKRYF